MIGIGTSLLFGKRAGKAGPPIMMLSEGEELVEEEITYPYPLVDEEEINNSDDWTSDEVI